MLGRLAVVCTVDLVRAVVAVLVNVTDKVQWDADFVGTSELVDTTLLIGTTFVFVRRITYKSSNDGREGKLTD